MTRYSGMTPSFVDCFYLHRSTAKESSAMPAAAARIRRKLREWIVRFYRAAAAATARRDGHFKFAP
jgi:hypothetical protein